MGKTALLLTDKFLPQPGGSQLYLGRVYERLRNVSTSVVTRSAPGARTFDHAYPVPVRRIPFVDVPKARMPLLWASLFARAGAAALTRGVGEVHCGQLLETGGSGWLLHRLTGRPYAVYTYGEEVQVYAWGRRTRAWLTRVLDSAFAVVAVSRATRDALVALGIAESKIAVAYPGVDAPQPSDPAASTRARYGLGDGPVLLTVGRLTERKGQDSVLRVIPRLTRDHPGMRYVIAGRGPDEVRLRRLAAEMGVEDRVLFLPAVSDRERAALYGAADLFVMPNRTLRNGDTEGFGIVFLEASQAGCPVIGGRSGGAVEAVADGVTGRLVDPDSPEALAEAVQALLSDPERRRAMGCAGREHAARFTWDATAATVDAHFAALRG